MKKFSQYNLRISLSDKSDILYNALTGKFIAVRRNLNLESVSTLSESVSTLLTENGMLVSADTDERGQVIEHWIDKTSSNNSFTIIINPTLKCNFNCWYCYEDHRNAPTMTPVILDRVKNLIDTIVQNVDLLNISFFGGEPLLEFSRIVEPLITYSNQSALQNNKDIQFSFTTNGFLLNEKMIEFLVDKNVKFMQITLDGGRISHNQTRISKIKDSFKTITTNIQHLLINKIAVTLRINVTPDNITDCTDILNWIGSLTVCQKDYLSVNIQQVWQTSVVADISDKIDDLLDSICQRGVYAYPAILDNLRNMCYADRINSIVINSDGNIFKCTAIDFSKEEGESNIFSNSIIEDLGARFKYWINKRFDNKSCNSCQIFPLCLGGCYKSIVSQPNNDYCIFGHNQEKKDRVVMTIIKDRIRRDLFQNQK